MKKARTKTLADLSVMFGEPQQPIRNWKNEFLRRSGEIFDKRELDKESEKANEKQFL